jgi:Skp family chaperone for outer membrane proteins
VGTEEKNYCSVVADPLDSDALFTLPLDEFTAARNALVKRLAAKGDDGEATRVKSLRKPSVTAWAVNRLAHDHSRDLAKLLEATDAVTAARNASDLRRTTAERTKVLTRLVDAARSILEESGRSAGNAQLEKITQTLQTGSTSEEYRDDLVNGRLQADLEPSGFFGAVVDFEPTGPAIDHKARAEQKRADELRRKAAAAEERAAKLDARARQLEETAAEARTAADRARSAAEEARSRAQEAAQPG